MSTKARIVTILFALSIASVQGQQAFAAEAAPDSNIPRSRFAPVDPGQLPAEDRQFESWRPKIMQMLDQFNAQVPRLQAIDVESGMRSNSDARISGEHFPITASFDIATSESTETMRVAAFEGIPGTIALTRQGCPTIAISGNRIVMAALPASTDGSSAIYRFDPMEGKLVRMGSSASRHAERYAPFQIAPLPSAAQIDSKWNSDQASLGRMCFSLAGSMLDLLRSYRDVLDVREGFGEGYYVGSCDLRELGTITAQWLADGYLQSVSLSQTRINGETVAYVVVFNASGFALEERRKMNQSRKLLTLEVNYSENGDLTSLRRPVAGQ